MRLPQLTVGKERHPLRTTSAALNSHPKSMRRKHRLISPPLERRRSIWQASAPSIHVPTIPIVGPTTSVRASKQRSSSRDVDHDSLRYRAPTVERVTHASSACLIDAVGQTISSSSAIDRASPPKSGNSDAFVMFMRYSDRIASSRTDGGNTILRSSSSSLE